MQVFTNILVGIDLAACNPLDDSQSTAAILEPIHWGIELARVNAARLLFFSASNGAENSLLSVLEHEAPSTCQTRVPIDHGMLQKLVHQAKEQGVVARSKVVLGEGWLEIVRQVLHDYFSWATTTTMSRYHRSADDVPNGLRIPHWSWGGLVDPA